MNETTPDANAPPRSLKAIRELQNAVAGQRPSQPRISDLDRLAQRKKRREFKHPEYEVFFRRRKHDDVPDDIEDVRYAIRSITSRGCHLTIDHGRLRVGSNQPIDQEVLEIASQWCDVIVQQIERYQRCTCCDSRIAIFQDQVTAKCSICFERLHISKSKVAKQ